MLEVLIAAAVLSIGLVSALNVIADSAATQRKVEDRSRALQFARSKLEEIMKEPQVQIGTEQGQGVDTTTDYDWQADVEQSSNPSLVVIAVSAQNRITGTRVVLTALRRPDVVTAPEGTGTDGTDGTDDTDDTAPAGGTGGGGT